MNTACHEELGQAVFILFIRDIALVEDHFEKWLKLNEKKY